MNDRFCMCQSPEAAAELHGRNTPIRVVARVPKSSQSASEAQPAEFYLSY
jgi:hypothetical protein